MSLCPCGCGQPRNAYRELPYTPFTVDEARLRTRPTSPTSVTPSSEWDGRLAEATTPGNDSRRLRGIPAIGRGVAGVINGTQPGAGYCGDCGKRSGEHHHRTCRQNGVIV
jgi:hypothetical protein